MEIKIPTLSEPERNLLQALQDRKPYIGLSDAGLDQVSRTKREMLCRLSKLGMISIVGYHGPQTDRCEEYGITWSGELWLAINKSNRCESVVVHADLRAGC